MARIPRDHGLAPLPGEDAACLDALVCEEWWLVCCRVCPDIGRAEFDRSWAEFQTWKAQRALN